MNFDFIQACRKIISFDTSPEQSTEELVEYLATLASSFGLHVDVQKELQSGVPQANILVRLDPFSPGDQEFLLQTHLDTTDPGAFSRWKKNESNPFDAIITDGKIYGLGTADVKLDFLCKLLALKELKNNLSATSQKIASTLKNLKPVLVGTFGEETGMQGALKLIRKNKINARYALIGEPSALQVINAAKGFATVEIHIPISEEEQKYKSEKAISESTTTQTKIFSGKSAHSSTPHMGESAALKLFDFLQQLPDQVVIVDIDAGTRMNMIPSQAMIELDISANVKDTIIKKLKPILQTMYRVQEEMQTVRDNVFAPEYSTLSVGMVRHLPNKILIGGSCRILPSVQQQTYEKWMSLINDACLAVGAEFKLLDYKRPFRTQENSAFVKAALVELNKLGIDSGCRSLASTNEASLFSRLGIECLCLGAGVREGNVHTPAECVTIADLEKVTKFYRHMLERFCL